MVMQPPPTRGEGAATGSAGSRAARARERRRSIAGASAPRTALSIPWSTLLRRATFHGLTAASRRPGSTGTRSSRGG